MDRDCRKRPSPSRGIQALVLLLLALVAPACGGGGGGGKNSGSGGNPYLISGDYHRISFSGLGAVDANRVGTSTFATGSAYSEAATTNVNGSISSATDSGTYSVSGTGDFSWTDTASAGFGGGTLSGGALAISSSVTAGVYPTAVVDVRKGGGVFTNATVSGIYWVVGYGWSPGTTSPFNYSYTGQLTADGSGGWSLSSTGNINGSIVTGSTNSGTYAVSSDGTATWTDVSSKVAQGGVLLGGDIVVTSVVTAGGGCEVLVGIRRAGSFTAASLHGAYHAISIGSSPGVAASHFTLDTKATFDAVSNLSWTATQNVEGTISAIPTIPETYLVQADGGLTINNTGSGFTFNGGVLAGGTVAIVSCVTPGGYMETRIYVRV